MPLPKPLLALDRHLRDQNREALQPKHWAPQAPMPSEPGICRWCSGALKALLDGDPVTYCQNGCATNDTAPFVGHCPECRRQFHTGKTMATFCHPCDHADAKRNAETGPVSTSRTYRFSRYGRGGYRD